MGGYYGDDEHDEILSWEEIDAFWDKFLSEKAADAAAYRASAIPVTTKANLLSLSASEIREAIKQKVLLGELPQHRQETWGTITELLSLSKLISGRPDLAESIYDGIRLGAISLIREKNPAAVSDLAQLAGIAGTPIATSLQQLINAPATVALRPDGNRDTPPQTRFGFPET